jgi:hypothetical protein
VISYLNNALPEVVFMNNLFYNTNSLDDLPEPFRINADSQKNVYAQSAAASQKSSGEISDTMFTILLALIMRDDAF